MLKIEGWLLLPVKCFVHVTSAYATDSPKIVKNKIKNRNVGDSIIVLIIKKTARIAVNIY